MNRFTSISLGSLYLNKTFFIEQSSSMIFLRMFRRPAIALLLLSIFITGCASYKEYPAGTRQRIKGKPEPVALLEVVEVGANPSSSLISPQPNDYRVGPNDILYVNVSGKPEFITASGGSQFKGYRVDGLGCIYLPIAGKVAVGGLPLSEVRSRIYSVMREYFNDPWIVVEISEYRIRQVFVFGAVKRPGPQPIPASGVNLAQVIATAEATDRGANFKKIRIIRSITPTEGELMVVDFDRMLRGRAMPLQLQEGDVVYVPKSAVASWNEVLSDLLPSLQTFSSVLQPFVNIKYLKQ